MNEKDKGIIFWIIRGYLTNKVPIFFDVTNFRPLGQKSRKKIVGVLEEMITRKKPSIFELYSFPHSMRLQTFLHNFHLNNLNQFLFASIICHYWRLIFAQNATEMHQGCAESRIFRNLDGTLHLILFYEINT